MLLQPTFDEASGAFNPPDGAAGAMITGFRLVRAVQPHMFSISDATGATVASLEVQGHALKPTLTLHLNEATYGCTAGADVGSLYNRLTSDPQTLSMIRSWNAWKATQNAPCDAALDSVGYFLPDKTGKVAVVFHGYGANPHEMDQFSKVLLDSGYNVLVPRLANHFDVDLTDLDKVRFSSWIDQSSAVFKIATDYATSATLVGYSLGGLIASRLALENQDKVDRMVLVAPAWRVTSEASLGSIIGEMLHLSLNDVMEKPTACIRGEGPISSAGGRQVELFGLDNELKFSGGYGELPVVYAQIKLPMLVFTDPDDNAVDTNAITEVCGDNFMCTHVSVPGRIHTNMESDLSARADGVFANQSMGDLITKFITTGILK